jgi:lysyl-tRNA synthetase class 2
MNRNQWQPSAEILTLRERAKMLAAVRAFFAERGVMEVDTHCLSQAAVSDPFIDSLEVVFSTHPGADEQRYYLQSSPEYAMKRLLAADSGPIYQLAKAFRNGEVGRLHNPEFTMLEWYRPRFSSEQLMDEVQALVTVVLGPQHWERLSYRDLFKRYVGVDPHQASIHELKALLEPHFECSFTDERKDTWLELVMSHLIEPKLIEPMLVFDFPASQAALAEVVKDDQGTQVAARFELYAGGMELANGYQELRDPAEQAERLEADDKVRESLGLPRRPLETRLVSALESGIPACAGVALGFDRLLMIKVGASNIKEVIPFGFERC